MTPRASDIYFKLLDSKMEKLGGLTSFLAEALPHWAGGVRKTAPAAAEAAKVAPKVIDVAAPAAAKATGEGYGLGTVLGATGLGAIGAGLLGSSIAEQRAAEQARSDKLKYLATGFGGGVATGLAAPSIMGGVNSLIGKLNLAVGNQGFMPSDTYGSSLGYYPEQY
jgi:hypothetical protein